PIVVPDFIYRENCLVLLFSRHLKEQDKLYMTGAYCYRINNTNGETNLDHSSLNTINRISTDSGLESNSNIPANWSIKSFDGADVCVPSFALEDADSSAFGSCFPCNNCIFNVSSVLGKVSVCPSFTTCNIH